MPHIPHMRAFAENWPDFTYDVIFQQAVGQIPWGHNLVLLSKIKEKQQRLNYAKLLKQNGWSQVMNLCDTNILIVLKQ